jgi:hypothetical protein
VAKRFLHVSVGFATVDKSRQLEAVFDKAPDWLRYMPNCWIIQTSKSPKVWYERLKPHLDEQDTVFIVAIDMDDRTGWLPRDVWTWINQERALAQ